MDAYEDMHPTRPSTERAPWYVVPADNKWFTRLVVVAAIVDALEKLDLATRRWTRPSARSSRKSARR